jgi:hypothetical protein
VEKVFGWVKSNAMYIAIAITVVIAIYFVWAWWRKKDVNTNRIVDDRGRPVQFSQAEHSQAIALAERVYRDLNSGVLWGFNVWGTIGRDTQVYENIAIQSDAMFALTVEKYREKYKTSMVADIIAESSLDSRWKEPVVNKANRLNIV